MTVFRESLRLAILRSGQDARLRIAVVDLDGVRLAAVASGRHSVKLDESNTVALLRPVCGAFEVVRGQRATTVEAGRSLFLDTGERTTSVSPGYQGLQALLPRVRIAETMAAMTQAKVPSVLGDRVLEWSRSASAQVDAYLLQLVRSLGAPKAELLESRWARQSASQALVTLLVGAMLESSPIIAVAAPWQVRRAEELLRARAPDPVSIADICRELQVGARALQLAFRRYRGTTPKQFLLDCRLALAREQLRRAGDGGSVTSVAMDCGFGHAGRFASAYRERFGELPMATLQRSRARTNRTDTRDS